MTNLANALLDRAAKSGDRPGLILDQLTLTFGQLGGLTRMAAGRLQAAGIEPGDRVALILPNIPAYPVLFNAVLAAGGVVVPLNPLLKHFELEYYFADSGAKIAFVWKDFAPEAELAAETTGTNVVVCGPLGPDDPGPEAPALAEAVARDDDDLAVILYTSGTTGKPKGAMLTHRNLYENARMSANDIIHISDSDVVMGCLPLFHVFGLTCGLNAAVIAGAALTLVPRFDPAKALEVIERDKVTIFEGVPTMYAALLQHPAGETTDTSSLRTCVSGGSAMPVEIMRAFEEKFGCAILEGYGLSETSPVAAFNMLHLERKPGTIGVCVPGCEMRLVDLDGKDTPPGEVGEIAIRGTYLMKGYWNKPEATKEAIPDGWFRTGDLATLDDEGYYTIVDRKKDMIIRGGLNVYPREVEEVLYEHPDVVEAAVVGIPDPMMGEEIGAAIALRPGATATLDEIQTFVKERLAAYKYPRHLWRLDELPKGPTGKILRREVKPPA